MRQRGAEKAGARLVRWVDGVGEMKQEHYSTAHYEYSPDRAACACSICSLVTTIKDPHRRWTAPFRWLQRGHRQLKAENQRPKPKDALEVRA